MRIVQTYWKPTTIFRDESFCGNDDLPVFTPLTNKTIAINLDSLKGTFLTFGPSDNGARAIGLKIKSQPMNILFIYEARWSYERDSIILTK